MAKRETLKSKRENKLYNPSVILHGNGKLLDYTDEHDVTIKYAQYNTRPIVDCPFRTKGCEAVCYATKGNHCFPSVKDSREKSFEQTRREDFSESIKYTVETEQESKRYKDCIMELRVHEAGEFYSLQYLKAWVKAWGLLESNDGFNSMTYTKAFLLLELLSEEEQATINRLMEKGKFGLNFSLDDTTSESQLKAWERVRKLFPLANTYIATEHPEKWNYDEICKCENCAKCGICNHTKGKIVIVKIHSASNADMEVYRANIK